jgi:hypothetical protein
MYTTKICKNVNHFLSRILTASSVLWSVALMMIPQGIETCSNVQSDTVTQNICKQYSGFCWTECCELIIDSVRNEQYKK